MNRRHSREGAARRIRWAAVRARAAWGIALISSAGACSDVLLDLTEQRERDLAVAGSGGAGSERNEAGASGEEGLGGAPVDALRAADFCEGGLGECVFQGGLLDCVGDVGQTALISRRENTALIAVYMTTATELRVAFELCDPTGYVLNIGDSWSNNGGGGDARDFEHDAELLIYDTDLTAFSSDLGYEQVTAMEGYHPLLLSRPDYVAAQGCSVRALHLRDQYIGDADDDKLRTQGPTALRINPSTDKEGFPNAVWYVGVNRVVSNSLDARTRVGSGMSAMRLCFTVPPHERPPRAGP